MTLSCNADGCQETGTFHLTWARDRKSERVDHLCGAHYRDTIRDYRRDNRSGFGTFATIEGGSCFELDLVVISESDHEQYVYLRPAYEAHPFELKLGIFEATSIDRRLQNFQTPRPLTHDLMMQVVRTLGGELQDVLVDNVLQHDRGESYYTAKLRIRQNNRLLLVDARPSDAFAAALIEGRPIFISDNVLASW